MEAEVSYLKDDYHSNYQEIRETEANIENFKSKNIFNDLRALESKSEKFIDKEFELSPQIRFLHARLAKFNKLTKREKIEYLTKFCELILSKKKRLYKFT